MSVENSLKGRASLVRLTLCCVSIVCALAASWFFFDNTNDKLIEKKRVNKMNTLGLPKVSIQNFASLPEDSQTITGKWSVDLFPNGVPYAWRNGDYLIWNGQNFSYTGSSPSVLRNMKRANATPMEGIPHYQLLMGLLLLVAGAGAGFSSQLAVPVPRGETARAGQFRHPEHRRPIYRRAGYGASSKEA